MDPAEWKIYHATRLLVADLVKSKKFGPMTVTANKYRGVISIDDFDVMRLKCDGDGEIEFKLFKRNVDDVGVEDLERNLISLTNIFLAKFE